MNNKHFTQYRQPNDAEVFGDSQSGQRIMPFPGNIAENGAHNAKLSNADTGAFERDSVARKSFVPSSAEHSAKGEVRGADAAQSLHRHRQAAGDSAAVSARGEAYGQTVGQTMRENAEQYRAVRRNLGAVLRHNRHRRGQQSAAAADGYRQSPRRRNLRAAELVPREDIHGFALLAVIAIMSFLAVWSLIAAHFISLSARSWSSFAAREAVVQIMPDTGQDMETALLQAAGIAAGFAGVENAHIVSKEETQILLTPWLGAQADIAALPVPRLIILNLRQGSALDFGKLEEELQKNIKGVRLDNRQMWGERLQQAAHFMLAVVLFAFSLVISAMILTVVFATGGALAGNIHILEVLHFIGADDRFITRQFDRHFFSIGLKGACLGGACACGIFVMLFFWLSSYRVTAEGGQIAVLFGSLSPDWLVFAEIAALILIIAVITMLVSHWAIMRRLRHMDSRNGSFFHYKA